MSMDVGVANGGRVPASRASRIPHKGRGVSAIDRHVGARVRTRRMMLGKSQTFLGDELGLTFQQVQKYERGTNRIGSGRLMRIAQILNVPVTWFYEGAPGVPTRPGEQAIPDFVTTLMSTHLGVELARSFSDIEDAGTRRKIADLVREIATLKKR